jgi:hypothetical protein
MTIPTWSDIRTFGNSRLLRSSYAWIIIVPIAARILSRTESSFSFDLGGKSIRLELALPFSWELFFYGALFTSFANALYSIRCPWLVKRFPAYGAFSGEGRGPNKLREEFTNLLAAPGYVAAGNLRNVVSEYHASYAGNPADENVLASEISAISNRHEAIVASEKIAIEPGNASEAFWYIRDYYDLIRPRWRMATAACYGMGFLLFGLVLAQNILFVIRYSIEQLRPGG